MQYTKTQTTSHINSLDGVRGIAALMIMVFHYWQQGGFKAIPLSSSVIDLAILGQTGVDLFFVLSGFLITRILIATKHRKKFFTNFYARRALRIFPLYFGSLIIFLLVLPIFEGKPIIAFSNTWSYWLYLHNIVATFADLSEGPGHFWSLAVEEHFYLVWPFIVYWLPTNKLRNISLGLIITALLVRVFFVFYTDFSIFYFTLCRVDALAFGSLLACLEKQINLDKYKEWFLGVLSASLPPLLFMWTKISGNSDNFIQVSKYFFVGLIYFALMGILVCYSQNSFISNLFANKLLTFTGTISYSLYVFHSTCYSFVFHFINPEENYLACLIVSFGLAYAIAWFVYQYFEAYFLQFKKYFS